MRVVNGQLLDDAVDEPEDGCEDCGEPAHACWCNDPASVAEDVAINNRPADGRVCQCEDAPCCGCYSLR